MNVKYRDVPNACRHPPPVDFESTAERRLEEGMPSKLFGTKPTLRIYALEPSPIQGAMPLQYVLVVAGAVDKTGKFLIIPGNFVFVKPSSQAYWRGCPVPEVIHQYQSGVGTLLGVLTKPPVPAGSNFGVPLAVITLIVQGPAELDADVELPFGSSAAAGWHACGNRSVFYSGRGPLERRIIIK